jgi:hypothetical protein
MDTLMIEAEGQPEVHIYLEDTPELVFQEEGLQGPPGPGIADYDPGDLRLIFDNQLI